MRTKHIPRHKLSCRWLLEAGRSLAD